MKTSHLTQVTDCRGERTIKCESQIELKSNAPTLRTWLNVSGLILLFALCHVTTPTASAQINFFDSVFAAADWEITFLAHPQPPSGGIASQELGPAPGLQYQRVQHTLGGTPTPSQVLSVHIYL